MRGPMYDARIARLKRRISDLEHDLAEARQELAIEQAANKTPLGLRLPGRSL